MTERYAYPVELTADPSGGFVASFPDVPGFTEGDDRDEALARAADALETAFIALMADRAEIPAPSEAAGRPTVSLPPLSAAKVALYEALRADRISKAELGRRLGWHMPQVDRLLDLRHASKLDQIEQALRVVGKRLVIDVREAAA